MALAQTPTSADPAAPFRAVFRLRYANSPSARALRRMVVLLDRAAQRGPDVSVAWEHDDDDAPELVSLLADGLHFLDVDVRALPWTARREGARG